MKVKELRQAKIDREAAAEEQRWGKRQSGKQPDRPRDKTPEPQQLERVESTQVKEWPNNAGKKEPCDKEFIFPEASGLDLVAVINPIHPTSSHGGWRFNFEFEGDGEIVTSDLDLSDFET
jgi:hypothetical protein